MRNLPILSVFSLALVACSGGPGGPDAMPPAPDAMLDCNVVSCREQAGQFAATATSKVDVLFVIDNSGTMLDEQNALLANFPLMVNSLFNGLTPPDLHIGVISTNMTISPYMTTGCTGDGDGGRLQSAPLGGCIPPEDAYLIDEDDGAGGRRDNYTGTLAEAFSCIAQLGTTGCGLEQPFAAMQAALGGTVPENAGFLRDDAYLQVVFLGDEDDCSAYDTDMFDPSQTSISDPLGPFGSYRCTEFGVLCDGALLPRSPNTYTSCTSLESAYMHDSTFYSDFLRALKPAGYVFVSAIVGDPTPFSVELDSDGDPTLAASCGIFPGDADPGVRYAHLLDGFPGQSVFTSICSPDWSGIFTPLVSSLSVGGASSSGCLTETLADVDAMTAGDQFDCLVYDVTDFGLPTEQRTPIPACGSPTCWRIEADFVGCSATSQHLRMTIDRTAAAAAGTLVVADCFVPAP